MGSYLLTDRGVEESCLDLPLAVAVSVWIPLHPCP